MKYILSYLVFSFLTFTANACDVCGCQMGGMSLGIMPQKSSNFVGLNYNYAHFKAAINHNSTYFDDEYSNDSYQSVDLVGKFNINKLLWAYAVLPYGYNIMDGSHQSAQTNGLKDPLVMGFVKIIDVQPDSANKNWHHLLNIGVGLKAPLGEFNLRDTSNLSFGETTQIINPNFQLGSGSWDYLAALSYKVKYKKIGLASEQIFKYNTINTNNYRFGNQYNTSLNVFSWWFNKGYSFLPFAGVYYEWADVHREFERQSSVSNSGGNAWFLNLGGKVIYNNWGLNITAQAPIQQNFSTDKNTTIEGGWRLQVGVRYFFEKWTGWK